MTTIVTRAGKGSALTHNEVDANFTNLNNAKYESGNNATLGTIQGSTITATTAFSGALNGTVGATTPAAGTFTSLSDSGNLTFTGTGNRITGDFNNATLASRVLFQNSVTNALTSVGAIPNGTANTARFQMFSSSDPSNSGVFTIGLESNAEGRLNVGATGTGTFLPLTFYTNSSERMRIDTSGNVGIGTSSPGSFAKFAVLQTSGSNALQLATTTNGAGLYFSLNNAGTQNQISYGGLYNIATSDSNALTLGTNNTERMRITSDGEVYIAGTTDQGAYNLQVNGTGVWGAGAYVNGSDARIKEDIEPISSSLDVVNKLNPVTYKYKENWTKDRSTQTGFIAQELLVALEGQNYVDGVVQQGGEYMSVAYQNIIPILTKAIQELNAKVEALEAQLNKE